MLTLSQHDHPTGINLLSHLPIVMLLWRLTISVRTRRPPAMSTSRRSLLPRLVMVPVRTRRPPAISTSRRSLFPRLVMVPVRTRRPPAMSTSRRLLLPRLVMVPLRTRRPPSCHVDEPKIVAHWIQQGLSRDETERPRPARVLPKTTPVMLSSNSPERCDHTSETTSVMGIPSMKQDSYTHETEPAIPARVPPLTTPIVLNTDSLNAAITHQKPQTALNTLTFLSIPP